MTISLSPKAIEEKLKSGAYRSADDVVHAASEALADAESFGSLDAATLDAIDRAEDQIERGEVHDWKAARERGRAAGV